MNSKSPPLPITIVGDGFSSKVELAYNGSREEFAQYVPAAHRPLKSNTTSIGALAHILKASLSSGILAMPLAFKNAGLLVGCISTVVIGFLCTHSIHIFVKTSQDLCVEIQRPCLGYAETCHLVFKTGPSFTKKYASFISELADWGLALTHLGACCVYVVVVAESFKQVSDEYGGPSWSLNVFCALTLIVVGPLTQITKLKYLVPFSSLANLVWVGSICISLYYCLRDTHDISERNLATSINGIPKFISTCLFAMEGIGVVMPVENEMLKPQHFLGCPGVLNIAMTVVVALYGSLGFVGYLSFGETVRGSIILDLPKDEILAQTAKILVACVMLLSLALIFYVPVDVVWRRLEKRLTVSSKPWGLALLRLLGALVCVGIACAVPKLELFMELIGALFLSVLGLLLPAVVETVWQWNKDLGRWYWIVWKNIIIGLFSLIALVSGVTFAILSMIESF